MLARHKIQLAISSLLLALFLTASPLQGAGRAAASFAHERLASSSKLPSYVSNESLSREQAAKQTAPSSTAIESSYYYQGTLVRLQRSGDKLSVRFRAGVSKASRTALVRGLSTKSRLTKASRLRGRDLSSLSITKASKKSLGRLLADLRANKNVEFAYPAWVNAKSGERVLLTDEVVVRLKSGAASPQVKSALAARDLTIARKISYTSDEYVLKLLEPKQADPLAVSRSLYRSGLVHWAVPNFVQELRPQYTPNDPLFSSQWYLRNTGQGGGTVGADARLSAAWDVQRGTADTTIAIIDQGIQYRHPDLAANIFTNRGEIAGNGVDDDHNGYVDDVHGWNFFEQNNDPNPDNPYESHGTGTAGVAAARGNNGIGVSGACPNCTILPVKLLGYEGGTSDTDIAAALRYAGQMADVLSNSWTGVSPTDVLRSALVDVAASGRDGKGAPIFFGTGNSASELQSGGVTDVSAGTNRYRWVYSKNSSDESFVGDDTAWLGWVIFPGESEVTNFESGSWAPEWSTGGDADWSIVNDVTHADESVGWTHAAKAGAISDGQTSYLDVVKTGAAAGDLSFYYGISSEQDYDGLDLWIDEGNDGSWDFKLSEAWGISPSPPYSGIWDYIYPRVSYPATESEVIAVGASTDFDFRAIYSEYGSELDLLAPSSGSPLCALITTTDLIGEDGYDPTSYTPAFGGTSSATPLAAGVAGLVLSRNPGLTEAQVRQILIGSADKIAADIADYGSSGFSNRYGYGRVNAQRALSATALPANLAFSASSYSVKENAGSAAITIKRGGNLSIAASAQITTTSEDARAGRDFANAPRIVSFAAGETAKTVEIKIIDNRLAEHRETVSLALSNSSAGVVLASPSRTALAIIDDDKPGRIASARLTKKIFKRNRARKVKLTVRFSPPSAKFDYRLSLMKNGKWRKVTSSKRTGAFVGVHKMMVKSLFRGDPVKRGRYRLRLTAAANSKSLRFTVT